MTETDTDADCRSVRELTIEWMQCVATQNTERVEELLTEDFIYSRHPKFGRETLDKREIITLMSSITDSKTTLMEQYMRHLGDVIVVHNVTQADQKVAGAEAGGVDDGGNPSFLDKKLIDSSAWRKEGGRWKCFDYRLIDAL